MNLYDNKETDVVLVSVQCSTIHYSLIISTNLHAIREHEADGHELGEDLEELRVGQHAVLQAVVQEAGVVAKYVINVGRLPQEEDDGQNRATTHHIPSISFTVSL